MLLRRFCLCALCLLLFCILPCHGSELSLRGVFVSTVSNLDFPSSPGLSPEEMKEELDSILQNTRKAGLNSIFFQVRPCADALYPSSFFPYSRYLTGKQGQAPGEDFDPLAYLTEKAHAQGIEVHAWINPYRVTQGVQGATKEACLDTLAENHPARKDPSLVIFHNGELYFDPALPQVRQLVADGVREILENYPVDGIHLDDYFYPGTDFGDSASYAQYGQGASLDDFRRSNVTELISLLHDTIEETNPQAQLGVSPFGIWANASQLEGGSDTAGTQSYFAHYADTRLWVQEGLLDYISPQLYWYRGQEGSDFTTLLQWWENTVSGTDCRLAPALAAYKAMGGDSAAPWQGYDEILGQIDLLQSGESQGLILFRLGSLSPMTAALGEVLAEPQAVSDKDSPDEEPEAESPLKLSQPKDLTRTDLSSYYFYGISDPSQPLTINGQPVLSRGADGSFGVLLSLEPGFNTFTLENGPHTLTCRLLRGLAASCWEEAAPLGDTYVSPGQQALLSLTARPGAAVTALFLGESLPLSWKGDAYQASIPLPQGNADQVTRYGSPLYVIRRGNFVTAALAPGGFYQRGTQLSLSFQVQTDLCDIYQSPDSSKGSTGTLREGMTGPVSAISQGYAQVPGLGYLSLKDISLSTEEENREITAASVSPGEEETLVSFQSGSPLAACCTWEDGMLKVRFPGVSQGASLSGEQVAQSLCQVEDGCLVYSFTLKDISPWGFYFEKTDQGALLHVGKKPAPQEGLSGVHILLDAGHGGSQEGAAGCDPLCLEKDMNLALCQAVGEKLQEMGATVSYTREEDKTLNPRQRFKQSFQEMPDLFLSFHHGSGEPDEDLSFAGGFSAFCQGELFHSLAQSICQRVESTGRAANPAQRGSLLYVCRQTHCPAVLMENGCLTNPQEFGAITDPQNIDQTAQAIAQAVASSFASSSD